MLTSEEPCDSATTSKIKSRLDITRISAPLTEPIKRKISKSNIKNNERLGYSLRSIKKRQQQKIFK